ncbi:MAG TPA: hypothetical protein VG797_08870 [Phycisphaerales bacterium]|nr:hypothetical protein [Phycisphaerales bacterium]
MTVFSSDAAAAIPPYSLAGSFELPAGAGVWDITSEGRVVTLVGDDIYLQDNPNLSSFTKLGSLPAGSIPSYGASFIRMSPDYSTLAIGDNFAGGSPDVLLVNPLALNPFNPTVPVTVPMSHTEAFFADNSTLYVSGTDSDSFVARLDVHTLVQHTVINHIGGSAAGVTIHDGYLYTSNGFVFGGPSDTGEVRAFPMSEITRSTLPLDFETQGIPVADALTGSGLGFDPFGNLLVGGGDVFGGSGDYGYGAVVDGGAILAALAGGPIAPDASELRLSPHLASDSYFPVWNPITGELVVGYYDNSTFTGGTTMYRYTVPAPGALSILTLAGLMPRRRRANHAISR